MSFCSFHKSSLAVRNPRTREGEAAIKRGLDIRGFLAKRNIATYQGKIVTESRSYYSARNESPFVTQPQTRTNPPADQEDLTKRQTNITMASDSDYASFLDKVNQDPSGGVAKTDSKKESFKTTDAGVTIPTVLKRAVVDAFYVSDGDEPFEVVGLKVGVGRLPDEGMLPYSLLFLMTS